MPSAVRVSELRMCAYVLTAINNGTGASLTKNIVLSYLRNVLGVQYASSEHIIGKWMKPGYMGDPQESNRGLPDFIGKLLEKTKIITKNTNHSDQIFKAKDSISKLFGADFSSYVDIAREALLVSTQPQVSHSFVASPRNINSANQPLMSVDFDLHERMVIDGIFQADEDTQYIKPQNLFHSSHSFNLWDSIRKDSSYSNIYNQCGLGLDTFLKSNYWKSKFEKIEYIVNFGAGAPEKDHAIIHSLKGRTLPNFYWVDSSLSMLKANYQGFRKLHRKNVPGHLIQATFSSVNKIRNEIQGFEGKNIKESNNVRVFFILGYTLSNLNEIGFFKKLKDISDTGDIFVFPMQLLPNSLEERFEFRDKLKSAYNFPKANDLYKAAFNMSERYEFVKFFDAVPDTYKLLPELPDSLRIRQLVTVYDSINATNVNIVTHTLRRHVEKSLETVMLSNGFVCRWKNSDDPPHSKSEFVKMFAFELQ